MSQLFVPVHDLLLLLVYYYVCVTSGAYEHCVAMVESHELSQQLLPFTRYRLILVESLVGSIPLDHLWSCLEAQVNKERLTLLKFLLSRVNDDSKYSDKTDDVMELAFKSTQLGDSSSDDELVGKIVNERNLPFFEANYHRHVGQLLSSEAAVLKIAFASQITDLDNTAILAVST